MQGTVEKIARATVASRRLWRRGTGIGVALALAVPALLISAQAANASWLQQSTPAVSGATFWELDGVSCVSPNVCMAVGEADDPSTEPLAEFKNRGAWAVFTVPEPTLGSVLAGVSCVSAKSCEAVGDSPAGAATLPLAEIWNGAAWQLQAIPVLGGATQNLLRSVSCTSPTKCVAVGEATKNSRNVPFAERLAGTKWSVLAPPSPAKVTGSEFNSVSCTSATRCVAVGDSLKGSKQSALAEVWNGAKWAIQKTPDLPKGQASPLNSVSCTSASMCMAGGTGMAEHWNGKSWSLRAIANPHGGTPTSLAGISCVRAGVCYGVGTFFVDGVLTRTAQFWNGSSWSNTTVPIGTSQDSSSLSGVSCTTKQDCTAVGFYHDPVDGNRALAEDFELRWQDQTPPPLGGVLSTGLNAVSCAGPRSCAAVGTFETSGAFETFTELWDGTGWTVKLPPKPKVSNLSGVWCTAPRSCIAVGDILTAGIPLTLAEKWNGIAWARQRTPNAPGAAQNELTSVACSSANACTAVGFSTGQHGKQATLAERWNGKKWTIQRTPTPAGGPDVDLLGVSCGSGTDCIAVGGSSAGRLVLHWTTKGWKTQTMPLPKGGTGAFLFDVSCTSPSACTAAGDFGHGVKISALAERWNGKAWKPQTVPAAGSRSGLTSVSCVSANACFAVGFAGGTDFEPFGEHWNGRRWASQPIRVPAGTKSAMLESLSCTSTTVCLAVGSLTDATSTEQMLAEQYS